MLDCRSGANLARDDAASFPDPGLLTAAGVGPLEGDDVRVAGLFGGGLSRQTEDGWTVEALPLTWPDERLVLCPPSQTMFWAPEGQADPTHLPGSATSLVAYGFSPTGRTLIVATSSDVAIFHRP